MIFRILMFTFQYLMMMMMMMMMMMIRMVMNCFCGMVDRRKTSSLISSRDHCQRSSPSRISDTPQAGFEPAQNLSLGLVEWSCAVGITTTPRSHNWQLIQLIDILLILSILCNLIPFWWTSKKTKRGVLERYQTFVV